MRNKTGVGCRERRFFLWSGLLLSALLTGCAFAPFDWGANPSAGQLEEPGEATPGADETVSEDVVASEAALPHDTGSTDAEGAAAPTPSSNSAAVESAAPPVPGTGDSVSGSTASVGPAAPTDSSAVTAQAADEPGQTADAIPTAPPEAATRTGAVPVAPTPLAGTQYAYDDIGLSIVVPDGWTQQLLAGGTIALFSGDYGGAAATGALMLISKQTERIPADDAALETLLSGGFDPAAVKQAGPIRFALDGKQAVQMIAKGTNNDGTSYEAMHTIIQSGGQAVSVKSLAFDALSTRKLAFDGVMASITFIGGQGDADNHDGDEGDDQV